MLLLAAVAGCSVAACPGPLAKQPQGPKSKVQAPRSKVKKRVGGHGFSKILWAFQARSWVLGFAGFGLFFLSPWLHVASTPHWSPRFPGGCGFRKVERQRIHKKGKHQIQEHRKLRSTPKNTYKKHAHKKLRGWDLPFSKGYLPVCARATS